METIASQRDNDDNLKRNKEDILPLTFFLMKFCGLWQPFQSNSFLRATYIAYRIFTMLTMATVGLSLVCVISISSENMKESVVENSFLLFTLMNSWIKAIIILHRHEDIESLLNVLLEKQCQPSDSVELEIQNKFDAEAKKITLNYTTLVGISVLMMSLAVFSKEGDERIELLNAWRPYNLKVQLNFLITWVHELLGHMVTASVNLSGDTLVPGLMIQLSCQLRFLRHRLKDFPRQIEKMEGTFNSEVDKRKFERSFISATISHHNTIFQFAKQLKDTFVGVLFTQFSLSLIIICFSVYKISKENTLDYSSLITLYTYAGCMLAQLFLFCWYGNELMLNSINLQDAFPGSNWLCLEEETKKSLIIMMIRSKKPILFSIGSMIFVNLDSFVSILKTSYSAYNVLQQST